jgi:signal transduction histidine kinase
LKFTRKGVLVAARKRGDDILIEVWDQGPGISPSLRPKIFDAFQQDATAGLGRERGVGLGLAVVKRFADRLNYIVSVDSRAGRGSVFRVRIPAIDASADRS